MGSVNVNRSVTDTFYRYKMPRLIAKVEGKGNGIKTVIVNMPDIAKALNRPATYPTKYFGCELGAQIQVDKTNDRFIVNGDHDAGKLQDLLDGFISRYVLCPECDNPETDLTVRRNQIFQLCKACGHGRTLVLNDRLSTYIVRNPPNGDGVKAAKKDKRNKKSKGEQATTPGDEPQDSVDGSGELKDSKDASGDDDEDDDWAVDPDDVAGRKLEMSKAMAALTANDDLDKSEDERLDMYLKFVNATIKNGATPDAATLVAEADRLDIREKAIVVICRCLLDSNVMQQYKGYKGLFLRFTHNNHRAQKYLLGGLEQLIMAHRDVLLRDTAKILMMFYEADIIEEPVCLEWGAKSSKRFVTKEENKEIRDKALPFLKWLETASEEESDEDDDEGEVAFEESGDAKTMPRGGTTAPTANHTSNGRAEEGDAEDLDIDDI